jgi:hypothetical protein
MACESVAVFRYLWFFWHCISIRKDVLSQARHFASVLVRVCSIVSVMSIMSVISSNDEHFTLSLQHRMDPPCETAINRKYSFPMVLHQISLGISL